MQDSGVVPCAASTRSTGDLFLCECCGFYLSHYIPNHTALCLLCGARHKLVDDQWKIEA